jgi:hypothetical protein
VVEVGQVPDARHVPLQEVDRERALE